MLNKLAQVFVSQTFSLESISGFPYQKYQEQLVAYEQAERWYTGAALEDQPQTPGKQADLYPMRINPIKGTVAKHAYALFGEVENDGRPLVVTKVIPPETGEESDRETNKKTVQHIEDVLNHVWWENNGRALMIQNAYWSQIYGGCVFKATYVPWEAEDMGGWRRIPIRIEIPNPKTFIGIPDGGDDFRLNECWIVRIISTDEAKQYGYTPGDQEEVYYIEHWTRTEYSVMINDKPATMKGHPLGGENPFGFVPVVYIPHVRDVGFIGSNAFDHLVAYVKELNLRYGDFGDATNDDAHPIIAIRDINGTVQVRQVTDWLQLVDLGHTQGITGNEKPPDMFEVRQQRASAAMRELIDEIWQQYMRDANTPPVSYGEDEGSQRSGMTLAMRFWPLGSHVSTERYFWTAGLDIFQPALLRMMFTKGIAKIKREECLMRMKHMWAPLLPRDREADVQEWVQRGNAFIGSPEHLLELAGDVEDISEERQRMLNWVEDLEAAKLKAAQEHALELQETTQEGEMEQLETQGETQIEVAEKQAAAFQQRPQPGAAPVQGKKPAPGGAKPPAGGAK